MNTPDRWVLIKITSPDGKTLYKVLAGWWGGYWGSDHWQLNSGVVGADRFCDEHDNPGWDFYGFSGSVYRCYDRGWGFTGLTADLYEGLKETSYIHRYTVVELVPEETDISTLNWTNQ